MGVLEWISHGPGREIDYSGNIVSIIHPALGVTLRRSRCAPGNVPPNHLRLMRMWSACIGSVYGSVATLPCSDSLSTCHLCDDDKLGATFICAICLLSWHPDCAACFVAERSADICNVTKPARFVLPEVFIKAAEHARDPLCAPCAMWLVQARRIESGDTILV